MSTLRVYPDQLAYFNELAGGPEDGYKHLLHSNLEWGQDLLFLFRTKSILNVNVEAPFPPHALGHRLVRVTDLRTGRRGVKGPEGPGDSKVVIMGFSYLMSTECENCRDELMAHARRYRYSVMIWDVDQLPETTRALLVDVRQ